MLIPLKDIHEKYDLQVDGVLHIGGHFGEECADYRRLKYTPVYWVEADPASVPILKAKVGRYGHHVVEALVSDKPGEVKFNIANNGQSSSILEFKTHSKEHPDVVFTGSEMINATTVDDLLAKNEIARCNFMNLDIQGAELMALKGAEEYLQSVEYIYCEVNKKELYEGCAMLHQLDTFLWDRGFERVELAMTPHGWRDAFWVRRYETL